MTQPAKYYLKEIKPSTDSDDPDNSLQAKQHYQTFYDLPIDVRGLRGDTICSFNTTFGKSNNSGEDLQPLRDGGMWKRSYTETLFSGDAASIVRQFRSGYHCLANFWPIPSSLNILRGAGDRPDGKLPNQADYPDLFLSLIRDFYFARQHKFDEAVEKELGTWLRPFGDSVAGWREFIRCYHLGAFVTDEDEPQVKDLFANVEQYQSLNAPVVGTHHSYGAALPQHALGLSPASAAANFAKNSLWLWDKRAESMAQTV